MANKKRVVVDFDDVLMQRGKQRNAQFVPRCERRARRALPWPPDLNKFKSLTPGMGRGFLRGRGSYYNVPALAIFDSFYTYQTRQLGNLLKFNQTG